MYGVNMNLVAARQLRGWTEEEAMLPIDKRAVEFEGAVMTLFEWCELLQLHHEDTYLRIIRGHKLEDIVKEFSMESKLQQLIATGVQINLWVWNAKDRANEAIEDLKLQEAIVHAVGPIKIPVSDAVREGIARTNTLIKLDVTTLYWDDKRLLYYELFHHDVEAIAGQALDIVRELIKRKQRDEIR